MAPGHAFEFFPAFVRQLNELDTPVMFRALALDEVAFLQAIDDPCDVTVGYHQSPGKLGHGEWFSHSLEFGENIKLWQRYREIFSEKGSQLLFDYGLAGQQA